MKKLISNTTFQITSIVAVGIIIFFYFTIYKPAQNESIELDVPYASQAPYGQWKEPWDEACEETSATMIDAYYKDQDHLPVEEVKKVVESMIEWEKTNQIPIEDTDANQTTSLINNTTSFKAEIKTNPTVEEIKNELNAKRPVIALINMYTLYSEETKGDSYHVLVITGYNERRKVFIVNDPARSKKEYGYDTLLHALHDFNPGTKEADGTPTVLFTKK